MTEKSIAGLHADLCKRIRSETDAGIISRLHRICVDDYARKAVLTILDLKPGDVWYEVSTDQEFKMVE